MTLPAPLLVRVLPIVASGLAAVYAIVERSIPAGLASGLAAVLAYEESRSGVTTDPEGIHVRNIFGAQTIEWRDVAGFLVDDGSLVAVTDAGLLPLAPMGRHSPARQAEILAALEAERP